MWVKSIKYNHKTCQIDMQYTFNLWHGYYKMGKIGKKQKKGIQVELLLA